MADVLIIYIFQQDSDAQAAVPGTSGTSTSSFSGGSLFCHGGRGAAVSSKHLRYEDEEEDIPESEALPVRKKKISSQSSSSKGIPGPVEETEVYKKVRKKKSYQPQY